MGRKWGRLCRHAGFCVASVAALVIVGLRWQWEALELTAETPPKYTCAAPRCVVKTTLRSAADKRGMFVGTAIPNNRMDDVAYMELAAKQHNLVTAEYSCRMAAIQPKAGVFDFAACDAVRDFARQGVKGAFRGHTLVWGRFNPSWFKALNASAKRVELVSYIERIARHYRRTAFAWDVVNEPVDCKEGQADPLKVNEWYPDVEDYIDLAFSTARKAFGPYVKLFLNDYHIGSGSSKEKCVYDMVKSMIDRGVPIDGVGLQMHVKSSFNRWVQFEKFIDRLAALGLEVHVTELDVVRDKWWEKEAMDEREEKMQARVYAELLSVCVRASTCKVFQTWGFTDRYTWMKLGTYPLPFDQCLQPKLPHCSMVDVLTEGKMLARWQHDVNKDVESALAATGANRRMENQSFYEEVDR